MMLTQKIDTLFTQRGDVLIQPMKRLKGAIMKPELMKYTEQLRGPVTRGVMDELAARNQARIKERIKEMGNKWIGHPDNAVQRKEVETQ